LTVTGSAYLVARDLGKNHSSSSALLLLAFACLVRLDMAITYLAFLSFVLAINPAARRVNVIHGVLFLAVAIGTQTLFRVWYFGDLLPNTYYLKMSGIDSFERIKHGAFMYLSYLYRMRPYTVLPVLFAVLLVKDKRVDLLAWIVATQAAYSVYVGGDAWEYYGGSNRFISISLPLFFLLFCLGIQHMNRALTAKFLGRRPVVQKVATASLILLAGYCLILFNVNVSRNEERKLVPMQERVNAWLLMGSAPGTLFNEAAVRVAILLNRVTTQDARIAVAAAGSIPYFSARFCIDVLGKCDRIVAHKASDATIAPGHSKWDFDHSVRGLRPDIIVQPIWPEQRAKEYVKDHYEKLCACGVCFLVEKGSDRFLWSYLSTAERHMLCKRLKGRDLWWRDLTGIVNNVKGY